MWGALGTYLTQQLCKAPVKIGGSLHLMPPALHQRAREEWLQKGLIHGGEFKREVLCETIWISDLPGGGSTCSEVRLRVLHDCLQRFGMGRM